MNEAFCLSTASATVRLEFSSRTFRRRALDTPVDYNSGPRPACHKVRVTGRVVGCEKPQDSSGGGGKCSLGFPTELPGFGSDSRVPLMPVGATEEPALGSPCHKEVRDSGFSLFSTSDASGYH